MNQVDQALTQALTSSDELMARVNGVFNGLAPGVVAEPIVVFQEIAGTDNYTLTKRATRNLVYLVKCIDKGPSAKRAGEIYDIIDSILHDATLNVPGYATLYIRRESDRKYLEVSDGVLYWHVGAEYRIQIAPE